MQSFRFTKIPNRNNKNRTDFCLKLNNFGCVEDFFFIVITDCTGNRFKLIILIVYFVGWSENRFLFVSYHK